MQNQSSLNTYVLELSSLIKSPPLLFTWYLCSLYFALTNKSQFLSVFALKNEAFIGTTETASFPEMGEVIFYVPHPRDFLIQTTDFLVMHEW